MLITDNTFLARVTSRCDATNRGSSKVTHVLSATSRSSRLLSMLADLRYTGMTAAVETASLRRKLTYERNDNASLPIVRVDRADSQIRGMNETGKRSRKRSVSL